jgi:hypothetical protein
MLWTARVTSDHRSRLEDQKSADWPSGESNIHPLVFSDDADSENYLYITEQSTGTIYRVDI